MIYRGVSWSVFGSGYSCSGHRTKLFRFNRQHLKSFRIIVRVDGCCDCCNGIVRVVGD